MNGTATRNNGTPLSRPLKCNCGLYQFSLSYCTIYWLYLCMCCADIWRNNEYHSCIYFKAVQSLKVDALSTLIYL